MTLSIFCYIERRNIFDAAFINITLRDVPHQNEIPQPFSGLWIVLVVIGFQNSAFYMNPQLSTYHTFAASPV